jgi:Tfp pilus assembly protein PilN
VRAVNLIPRDLRGGGGASGSAGPAVYVLLGGLGLAVVLVTLWALAGKSISDSKAELAQTKNDVATLEARAGELEPYIRFAELHAKRVETVGSLARSRFNWPFALREISRVLPKDVWLTQLLGTVAPGVSINGASNGATGSLRQQRSTPAIELSGCTMSQSKVAQYLADLRRVEGVTQVSIAKTERNDVNVTGNAGGDSAPSTGEGGDRCDDRPGMPKFEVVIFFEKSTATQSIGGSNTPTTAKPTNGAEPATGGDQ